MGLKNLQIENGVRNRVPKRFADLPHSPSIDLSRQRIEDVGSSKVAARTPPCIAGFLYSHSHGPVGFVFIRG